MKKKIDEKIIQQTIAILVAGQSEAGKLAVAHKYHLSPKQLDNLWSIAEERIKLASISDRQTELGLAKRQLESIVAKAISTDDLELALKARKELSKLLRLNEMMQPTQIISGEDNEVSNEDARQIRAYLESLDISDKNLPLPELARVVATYVIDNIPESVYA